MSVYFITCREANAVKIGHSVDPYARLLEIQLGCPLRVTLEAVLPGKSEEERAMHWRFSEHRIRGEWFTLAPEIELVIAAHPAPPQPRASRGRLSAEARLERQRKRYQNAEALMRAERHAYLKRCEASPELIQKSLEGDA